MNTYPRETVEYIEFTVLDATGTPVTSGVQYSVTTFSARPTTWATAPIVGGHPCILISSLSPGVYQPYFKISGSPESPVYEGEPFKIT